MLVFKSYLRSIIWSAVKNENPALMVKIVRLFAGLHLLFPLYSRLCSDRKEESTGVKESEEERRRTGQLQCGQVCRVSREREHLEWSIMGLTWRIYILVDWLVDWLIEMRCGLTCVRSGLSPWSIPTRCVTKKEGGVGEEGGGKIKNKPNVIIKQGINQKIQQTTG